MVIANFLAQLWGFSLIIICLSFLIKPGHVATAFSLAQNQANLLVSGIARVVLGVASLLAYNTWDGSWKVIVVVLGWLLVIKGATHLFFPEFSVKMIQVWQVKSANWLPVGLVIGVIFGCVLVYFGMTF